MTLDAISFGAYIGANDVRDAVQTTIATWSRTYLAEMARHDGQAAMTAGQPTLPDFRSYVDSIDSSITRFPEEQFPSCVIVAPGLSRKPERKGSGLMSAPFAVTIGVVVSSVNKSRTIRLAELYTTAVRMLMLQHGSLGGFASRTYWQGERFTTPQLVRDSRTMAAGALQFEVVVDNVADISQGPVTPIDDGTTPTGWTTVGTPDMAVTPYSIDEEIPT